MRFILGLKLGMSQIFDKEGKVVPVTLIEAGPCFITQIKTKEPVQVPPKPKGKKARAKVKLIQKKNGYDAIQVGFKELKPKKIKKTQKKKPFRYLKEFKGDITKYKVGDKIDVSTFKEGDLVKISGISKGKGFAGVVKRWHFRGRTPTHGTRHQMRTPGSVGSRFPQRIIKGKRMAGRMGFERVSIKNLKIVKIEPENNILAIKGAIPGPKGVLVEIRG